MLHQYVRSKINRKNVKRFDDAVPTKKLRHQIIWYIQLMARQIRRIGKSVIQYRILRLKMKVPLERIKINP